ncbi:MAG: DUF1800 domain-containing protein [Phycisphaerales bacterium]
MRRSGRIQPESFGYDEARHLLWRAGFGGNPEQIRTLAEWGPERSVDYLLGYDRVADPDPPTPESFDRTIMRPPTADERDEYRRAQQVRDENTLARFRLRRQEAQRADRRQMRDIQRWWLARMISSPRPLQEKMTLFWHGHFATSYRTIENSYHMFMQNQLFRTRATGNLADLLFQIIRDPAMLAYLDNNESKKGKPNENLARELLELFSLGVGHYTERDIKEGARALTGYSFDDDRFVFREADHDTGVKRILGSSGAFDGDDFVKAILAQRQCSAFICRKLYRFFAEDIDLEADAGDLPDGAYQTIRAMQRAMLASKYELKPTLRELFLSEHFYTKGVIGGQIKSPTVLVVGAVRSLGVPVRDLSILLDGMDLMGQSLFFPPSVKGWDGGRSWINTSTLFVRQNLLAYLLTGKKPHGYDALADREVFDPSPLLSQLEAAVPGSSSDAGAVASYLLRLTLGRADSHAADELVGFLAQHRGPMSDDVLTGALLLITAMPEYQLC